MAIATVSTDVYIIGGYGGAGDYISNNTKYTPSTNTYNETIETLTTASHLFSAFVDTDIYVTGGHDGSLVDETNMYDVSGDVWAPKATLTTGRRSHSAEGISGGGFIWGGYDTDSILTTDEYDSSGDAWANVAGGNMLQKTYQDAGGTIATKIYSYYGAVSGASYYRKTDEFDTSGKTWGNKSDGPLPARATVAAATVSSKSYVVSGYTLTAPARMLNDNDEYDGGVSDTWTAKKPLFFPERWQHSGAAVGTAGYFFGGRSVDSSYLRAVHSYTPSTNAWAARLNLPAI